MTKISIIILTYNHENFISENLKGVLMQQVEAEVELIICDDHSNDKTATIVAETIKDVPNNFEVRFFQQPDNLGATPNFYFALEKVTGDYVAFCEGDDYWTDPKKLQIQLDFLQNNTEYSLCFHTAVNISNVVEVNESLFSKVEDREYSAAEIYKHWIIHTATVMLRAEVLQSEAKKRTMKRNDLQYFDTILFLAASSIGKIRGIPRKMSAYRRHEAGLSAGKINFSRDLKHNQLDKIIGEYYGGEIKKLSDWHIFSRSDLNFQLLIKENKIISALKFLPWLLRNRIFIYAWKKK